MIDLSYSASPLERSPLGDKGKKEGESYDATSS